MKKELPSPVNGTDGAQRRRALAIDEALHAVECEFVRRGFRMDNGFDRASRIPGAEATALVARLRALGLVLDAVIESMRRRRERLREMRAAIEIVRADAERFRE
jgi:hypothetical protein